MLRRIQSVVLGSGGLRAKPHSAILWRRRSSSSASQSIEWTAMRFRSSGGQASPLKASGRVESGRGGGMSNPWAGMEHMKHQHLLLMCALCLAGGYMAGNFAEFNEDELYKLRFDREDIDEHFRKVFELRPDMAATCIRLAFVLAARRAGVASVDIEESCSVLDGLEEASQALGFTQVSGTISTEDVVALGTIAAIKFLKGPHDQIKFNWCREDLEKPPERKKRKFSEKEKKKAAAAEEQAKKDGEEQSSSSSAAKEHFPLPFIMKHIGKLSTEESVAIMACHGVGEYHEYVSGFDNAARLPRHFTLNNNYFKAIMEYKDQFKKFPVYRSSENENIINLPEDFVSVNIKDKKKGKTSKCVFSGREVAQQVKDPKWFQIVEAFAKDKALWEKHFVSGMQKLLDSNFKNTLRSYDDDLKKKLNLEEELVQQQQSGSTPAEGAKLKKA